MHRVILPTTFIYCKNLNIIEFQTLAFSRAILGSAGFFIKTFPCRCHLMPPSPPSSPPFFFLLSTREFRLSTPLSDSDSSNLEIPMKMPLHSTTTTSREEKKPAAAESERFNPRSLWHLLSLSSRVSTIVSTRLNFVPKCRRRRCLLP